MLLVGLALAQTQPEGVVRAAVVVTGTEVAPSVLATTRTDTETLLEASGRYQVLDPAMVEGRLGFAAATLQCAEAACWANAGAAAGVDQLVVLHLRADWVGPRTDVLVVDVAGARARQAPSMHLPKQGGAPIDSLEMLLLGDGALKLSWEVPDAELTLNGVQQPARGGFSADLPAGKHLVRIEAEGYAPVFAAVLVVPGEDTHLALEQHPVVVPYTRRNWGPWAAAALVGVGTAALAATSQVPAVAMNQDSP